MKKSSSQSDRPARKKSAQQDPLPALDWTPERLAAATTAFLKKYLPNDRAQLKAAQQVAAQPQLTPIPILGGPPDLVWYVETGVVKPWGDNEFYVIRAARETVLTALKAGDPEPLFAALPFWPDLLDDPEVRQHSFKVWSQRKHLATTDGKKARAWLTRIGTASAWIGRGAPELPPADKEHTQREQHADAQRHWRYLKPYQDQYATWVLRGATEQRLREMADRLIQRETPQRPAPTKRRALDEFRDWVEADLTKRRDS
jgi:hypothetical protein